MNAFHYIINNNNKIKLFLITPCLENKETKGRKKLQEIEWRQSILQSLKIT